MYKLYIYIYIYICLYMYIQFRTKQNLHILHRFCKSHVKKIGFQRFQSYNDLNAAKAVTFLFFFVFLSYAIPDYFGFEI